MNIEQMQADVAPMDRAGAIGYLRRRPGSVEVALDRLTRNPDGSPSDYAAAVDALEAYGRYLAAFADAIRDK